jgi:ABC-type bacteriocin/lantibiotic exporter with double-glycine peptidase domain
LGVVLQNGQLSSASIFENIAGGAQLTLDEAWEAAQLPFSRILPGALN